MENFDFMFAAFAIIWIVFFAYIIVLSQKQKQLRRDIDQIEVKLRGQAKE